MVALDQSEDGEWAQALKERTEAEFIRSRGYDAYVEVIFGESGWGGVLGSAVNLWGQWQYEPGFWIYTVKEPGDRKMIKYTLHNSTMSCAVNGRKILNYGNKYELKEPEQCAQRIADIYRKELIVTLAH